MAHSQQRKDFFQTLVDEKIYASASGFKVYAKYLFREVPFTGKTMVDIGGGIGLQSLYAAHQGAQKVVCLEPEAAGATTNTAAKFERLQKMLELPMVEFHPETLQQWNSQGETFDIVLLHNSINHLDEPLCERLHHDQAACDVYRELFRKIGDVTPSGGTLIVADCTRHNFFAHIGTKNPFVRTIEWNKHQSPRLWARLLSDVGFRAPRIRWTSFNRFGNLGRVFLGNAVAAYFLNGHFCLTMRRQ